MQKMSQIPAVVAHVAEDQVTTGWYKQWTRGPEDPWGPAFTTLYCTYNG